MTPHTTFCTDSTKKLGHWKRVVCRTSKKAKNRQKNALLEIQMRL